MNRVFSADHNFHLLHDPATGLTHDQPPQATSQRRVGGQQRLILDDAAVYQTAVVVASRRLMPTTLHWSPAVHPIPIPRPGGRSHTVEIASDHRRRIVDILADCGVLGIDIAGEDPLRLPDLPALARTIIRGGRTAVSITTSGHLLERRADELVGTIDAVRVAFPAADTGDDRSLHRVISGVRVAATVGLPVQIEVVLTSTSRQTAQTLVDLTAASGAVGLTLVQHPRPDAGRDARHADRVLDEDEARGFLDSLVPPDGYPIRLRTRRSSGGVTLIHPDGQVRRTGAAVGHWPLRTQADLLLAAGAR